MTLLVLLPEKVLLRRPVRKIVAEGQSGAFGLLPRHVDFVEVLVPGILAFVPPNGEDEVFVAVDEGLLVKCGQQVRVSVRNAVIGPELGELEQTVRDRFQQIDAREQNMRTALAKLESEVIRSFIDT
ncbi:F0F1 ATP synthase subunit epsilon [Longibacter salinarum]|uniref:F0F1 ATP synthase subunit epsilon n=1 Tax=Longibacter salinarum TaxID=1850348 RepID=A0A2A8D343_9BACT|nr:F0F1 ATP synthase subunit epsilon [Longibacter salinarum]PEN15379.1 F0F1 ATP synthase subunit epsilon [Longibacter salinarum]